MKTTNPKLLYRPTLNYICCKINELFWLLSGDTSQPKMLLSPDGMDHTHPSKYASRLKWTLVQNTINMDQLDIFFDKMK